MNLRNVVLAGGLLALSALAQAFQVVSVSPQGEVARITQLVVKFGERAGNFGDPKAPAPLDLRCRNPKATQGTGRWLNDRQWVYDFEADLPPGVACTIKRKSGSKSVKGAVLTGSGSYKFNSGGPFVQEIWPCTDTPIDEDQFFVLQLSGPATLASVLANTWCAVEGLGERVAVRQVDGKDRAALLKFHQLLSLIHI